MISAFTFVHNAIKGGYPIREAIEAVRFYCDEIVVVDARSTDGTRELLNNLSVRILDAEWGEDGGETLKRLHAMHTECEHDIILHFEADEVYDEKLLNEIKRTGSNDLRVWRLQVEQNFQRIRWYPELVHRLFKKGSVTKEGHTTNRPDGAVCSGGYLWDCTNCYRDNYFDRITQQSKLRKNTTTPDPMYLMVPKHCIQPVQLTREQAEEYLKEPHWTWTETPLAIPRILESQLGKTKYES